jgi:hypothetical protein
MSGPVMSKTHPRPPDILRKGHTHVVEREPDYRVEIKMGLIEYEDQIMAKQLEVGGDIEVLPPFSTEDEWVPATIIDLLATQFTCNVEGNTRFYFYADKDVTWRQLREGE